MATHGEVQQKNLLCGEVRGELPQSGKHPVEHLTRGRAGSQGVGEGVDCARVTGLAGGTVDIRKNPFQPFSDGE